MRKEDKLCFYIEHLINSVYCGKVIHDEEIEAYNKLIDGFKKIGFRFDQHNPVTFKELDKKQMEV